MCSALLSLLPVALLGCVPTQWLGEPSPSECSYLAPKGSDPYWPSTGDPVLKLVGRFDLVSVTTSAGAPPFVWHSELTLVATDSRNRPVNPIPIGEVPRLAGTLTTATGDPSRPLGKDTVQVEWDTLYVGCRGCSRTAYRVIALTPTGFWGLWIDPQEGIGKAVDSTGRWLPNPAGYFCALRLSRGT